MGIDGTHDLFDRRRLVLDRADEPSGGAAIATQQ